MRHLPDVHLGNVPFKKMFKKIDFGRNVRNMHSTECTFFSMCLSGSVKNVFAFGDNYEDVPFTVRAI